MLVDNRSPFVPQQFSSDIAGNASVVCLAHLFTYQDFDEGTLGLAYVAPSKPQALGGLCPKRKDTIISFSGLLCKTTKTDIFLWFCTFVAYYPSHSVKKPSYLNTGLTSTMNYGKTILTKVCFTSFSIIIFDKTNYWVHSVLARMLCNMSSCQVWARSRADTPFCVGVMSNDVNAVAFWHLACSSAQFYS